jgi:hypothetical protein
MFIITGFKKETEVLADMERTELCMNCCHELRHQVMRYREYFTLFFVPLFPVSSRYTYRCPFCTYEHKITKAEANHYVNNVGFADVSTAEVEKYVG